MAIQAQPSEAPTASPAPREQSISTFLHGEVMNDLDDGRPTLLSATESNLGDLRETSPARLLGMVADARKQLDEIERLANVYEAEDTIRAILAEHGLTLEEVAPEQMTELFGPLASRVCCWAGKENGHTIVWMRAGQDPIHRVNDLVALVNDPDSIVREGAGAPSTGGTR
ncbi:hypothetical protein [Streptomyces sp. NPDC051665]|uniref:hypothetical protein n=1 Tax=Streptomyces sp. NPDC051665 TaxID=3154647 RepID=UPI0034134FB0